MQLALHHLVLPRKFFLPLLLSCRSSSSGKLTAAYAHHKLQDAIATATAAAVGRASYL